MAFFGADDNNGGGMNPALAMGLLQGGLNMLAASQGGYGRPNATFGNALAHGLSGFSQGIGNYAGYSQAQQMMAQQNLLNEIRMAQLRGAEEERLFTREQRERERAGLDELIASNPEAAQWLKAGVSVESLLNDRYRREQAAASAARATALPPNNTASADPPALTPGQVYDLQGNMFRRSSGGGEEQPRTPSKRRRPGLSLFRRYGKRKPILPAIKEGQ